MVSPETSPNPARPPRPIGFTGSHLDRAGNPRRDPAWLSRQRARPDARFLMLHELKALIDITTKPAGIAWLDAGRARPFESLPCVFLGVDPAGIPHFVLDGDQAEASAGLHGETEKYIDVRSIAAQLRPEEAAILAQARSVIDWHQRHGFCAQCGARTAAGEAGYMRKCTSESCGAQHFPRTDPVVIMLAVRRDPATGEDMVLMGRQGRMAPGMYSALAGFMEPGESLEEAVRREILEEAGIKTGAVRYLMSQPWPFPSSLMIGCVAEATSAEITVDPTELEDARWFRRSELPEMLERGKQRLPNSPTSPDDPPWMPPPLSLAHQIAKAWLAGA